MTWRRTVVIGLGASLLTACTVSISGGLLGAVASIGLALLVFLLAGVTQTGCIEDRVGRDDAGTDAEVDVGPCLRDVITSPCLSDAYIGPCLSADAAPPPDAVVIGPCLGAPLQDQGVELDIGPCLEADASPPDATPPDMPIGPCLEAPPEPEPPPPPGKAMQTLDRGALFAKVAAHLPPDVAARLVRPPRDV